MTDFDPDAYLASKQGSANVGSAPSVPVDQTQSQGFDPDDYLNQKINENYNQQQSLYGTASQQAIAGVEGAARGLSGGESDELESGLNISTPENIKGRMEANPKTAFIGSAIGTGALIGLTGGIAAPIEALGLGAEATEAGLAAARAAAEAGKSASAAAKIGQAAARTSAGLIRSTGASAAGLSAEGAAIGAGQWNSDRALGDPDANAQKLVAYMGTGALWGAGIAGTGGGLRALSKGIEAAPIFGRKAPIPEPAISGEAPALGAITDNLDIGIKPSSIEDLIKRNKEAEYQGQSVEMPEKAALIDATSRVPMLNQVHPLQLESLDNQGARDLYKIAREMEGKEGNAIRNHEAFQKKELVEQTDRAIQDISPGIKPTDNAFEGGKRFIDTATEQYQSEKDAMGAAFAELRKAKIDPNQNHLVGSLLSMTDAVPGLSNAIESTSEKGINLKPYSTSWGVDKDTYTAFKQAVSALKEDNVTFEKLWNIRKGLDQNIDIMAKGQAPREIGALKKAMMTYMEKALGGSEGSGADSVRQLFKRYAINEEQRAIIEKKFGASVGNGEFGQISKVKPEKILDAVFKDTATTNAARNIFGEEKFHEMLANHLAERRRLATDNGVFKSSQFKTFLKGKEYALDSAFASKPEILQKLKDVNTIMRILPDSVSANPSGTAKTLFGILKAHSLGELIGNTKAYATEKFQKHLVVNQIDNALQGKGDHAVRLNSIKGIISRITNNIASGVKSVISKPESRGAILSSVNQISHDDYKKNIKQIKKLSGNETALLDHLSESTHGLYAAAPNITQSLHSSVANIIQFLNSKIPSQPESGPFSAETEPSAAEISKFNRYFSAVHDPLDVFRQIKNNTITQEHIETLQAVYPKLYQEMKHQMLDKITSMKNPKSIPYQTKIALSQFLGEPVHLSLTPQAIAMNQAQYNQPQQAGPSGAPKPTQAGMSKLSLASRMSVTPEENI